MPIKLGRAFLACAGALLASPLACAIDFDADFAGGPGACEAATEQCAPAAPAGWSGPAIITPAAACPGPWTLVSSGVACPVCTCGGGVTCSASVTLTQDGCGGGEKNHVGPLVSGACSQADPGGGNNQALGQIGTLSGGCTPSTGAPAMATLCAAQPTGACGPGSCVPASATLCVYQTGILACPAGPYVLRQVVGGGTCSPCTCGSPMGSCGGSTHFFDGSGCTGAETVVPNDGTTCVPFNGSQSARYDASGSVTCAPSGGEPTPPDGAITICCTS